MPVVSHGPAAPSRSTPLREPPPPSVRERRSVLAAPATSVGRPNRLRAGALCASQHLAPALAELARPHSLCAAHARRLRCPLTCCPPARPLACDPRRLPPAVRVTAPGCPTRPPHRATCSQRHGPLESCPAPAVACHAQHRPQQPRRLHDAQSAQWRAPDCPADPHRARLRQARSHIVVEAVQQTQCEEGRRKRYDPPSLHYWFNGLPATGLHSISFSCSSLIAALHRPTAVFPSQFADILRCRG